MIRSTLKAVTGLAALFASTPSWVLSQEALQIDVRAQPLAAAIAELGRETGLQVGITRALSAGKQSTGVRGVMTPRQALDAMLEGTGLQAASLGADGAMISQTPVLAPLAASEDLIGEDIIVQGELIQRTKQDSQTSVAVIRGEELEQRSDPDLFTVIERTPGATIDQSGSGIAIRGIPEIGFGSGQNASNLISVQVDGATLSNFNFGTASGPYSVWDLEQVEILRGPQSTQTGRNALAGAVRVRSQDPTQEFEFKMRGELGTMETLGGAFAVNIPIEDTSIALRLSADVRKDNGFITNITTSDDEAGASEYTNLRAGLSFRPTDHFEAVLKYTYNYQRDGEESVLETSPGVRTSQVDALTFERSEVHSVNLRMAYDLTDELTLRSETTYFMDKFLQLSDGNGTGAPGSTIERPRDFSSFEQEIALSYDAARLRGTIGIFFTQFELESGLVSNFNFPGFTGFLNSNTDRTTKNIAGFGEFEFDVLPELTLLAGLRYDRETFESFGTISSNIAPPSPPVALDTSFDAFLPKAGVVYRFTEDASLGFTAQQGYRAGGVVSRAVTPGIFPFAPEKTWNFELAARTQWLDGDLTANANAFFTRWTDQQVAVVPNTGPGGTPNVIDRFTVNAGKSRLWGGEVEVFFTPTDSIELFGSAAYTDTKFTDFIDQGVSRNGNEFPGAAKLTAALGGTYTLDDGWFVSADASYTSSAFSDIANTPVLKSDARVLVNARAGYRNEHFEVFGYARNLFDETYATGRFAGPVPGTASARPGEPLTFGVIGQVNF